MSPRDKRDVTDLHRQLMDRFPHAFPKDYDALRPLKLGIHADIFHRWPEVDPVLLRRALANHTRRDGYLLALLHHRGDRRYDLDGQPVGTVTPEERAEAARLLAASTQRGQAQAAQVRTTGPGGEAPPAARAEQRNRKRRRRARPSTSASEQEIAARKAALIAQGITPESAPNEAPPGPEVQVRIPSARRVEPHSARRPPVPFRASRPERRLDRAEPAPAPSMPPVEFRKKRRIVPPPTNQDRPNRSNRVT